MKKLLLATAIVALTCASAHASPTQLPVVKGYYRAPWTHESAGRTARQSPLCPDSDQISAPHRNDAMCQNRSPAQSEHLGCCHCLMWAFQDQRSTYGGGLDAYSPTIHNSTLANFLGRGFMRNVVFVALLLCSYLPARAEVSMEHPVEILDIHRSPPNLPCAHPCNRTAVLFVHGFNCDRTTWQNGDMQWPKLLADDPQIGPDLDVYRLDYFSRLTQGPAVPKLTKIIAEQLDQKFFGNSADPNPQTAYSKIVMVCHSLGGILCRNYLLHVKLRWGHQFLSLMRATITLGTPLSGAELANFHHGCSRPVIDNKPCDRYYIVE
jgi:hypothetical protein